MVQGESPQHRSRLTPEQIATDIARGIEDAAEALRWCKTHLGDRRAADAMRLVELNLSFISQAIDYQMEGEHLKAEQSVDRIWWQPHKPEYDDQAGPPKA